MVSLVLPPKQQIYKILDIPAVIFDVISAKVVNYSYRG